MSQIIRFDPRRAGAVRDAVTARCDALKLCRDARERAIGRAFHALRENRSAAVAIAEGIALAKRLAGAAHYRATSPEPAA